jgi:hypothetical protein
MDGCSTQSYGTPYQTEPCFPELVVLQESMTVKSTVLVRSMLDFFSNRKNPDLRTLTYAV